MQIENLINKSTDTKNTDTKTINDMTAGMRVSDYIKTDSSDNMSKKAAVVGSSNSVDMSDTIYARPQAKNEAGNNDDTDMAENLLNDMNQTSENRRNDMIVTASTTTSDDYKAAKDDGYDVIVTETDKIKAVLAKAGVDISIYGDDLSKEQLTDITGSQTEAAMLVNQMKAYDIPATDDNIKAGTDAIDRAKSLTNISNETKAYLVRNNMNPTVSNVYKATYSSSQVQDYRQKTKMTEISDELFEELKPQLKQILEEAHIDSSDENLNQCRWLIDEDIAVTPDNVLLANQVDCINAAKENVSSDFYARAVTEALAMGKKATDATMSQDGLTFDMDWKCTQNYVKALADAEGIKLRVSYRVNGFFGELYRIGASEPIEWIDPDTGEVKQCKLSSNYLKCKELKEQATEEMEELLKKYGYRMKFPAKTGDLSRRWCSAYLKICVADTVVSNLDRLGELEELGGKRHKFPAKGGTHSGRWCSGNLKAAVQDSVTANLEETKRDKKILIVSGERRGESAGRSKYNEMEIHRTNAEAKAHRIVHQWRCCIDYSEKDVWELLKRHHINPHPCYRIGWNRCSCMMCIFSTPRLFAGVKELFPDDYAALRHDEEVLGFTLDNKKNLDEFIGDTQSCVCWKDKAAIHSILTGSDLIGLVHLMVTLNSTLAPENLRKKGNLMFAVMVCTSVRLLPTVSIITVSTVKTRLQKSLLMVM